LLYGYARVSTAGQAKDGNSLEHQEKMLRDAGAAEIYADSFTGTKLDRPQLNKLLARLGEGDTLIVAKLDRVARSLMEGSRLISELIDRKIVVNILNIGVMDNTPSSKLIRNIFFAFAEFERDMIAERTQEGKAAAKTKAGFKEGRPKGFTPEQIRHALELLDSHTYTEVVKMTRISKSTLIRARRGEGRPAT
jgi:DNA invertase Pin-like site-specific DNA recombinase